MPSSNPARVVALDGVRNFRDLGGYPTHDGKVTRWGHIYRADSLSLLTPTGWEQLTKLGIHTVYDLRHQVERDRSPTIDPGLGLQVRHLGIGGEAAEAASLIELFRARGDDARWDAEFVATIYRDMLMDFPTAFGELLSGIADPERRPAVFHCTAGKDRTGLAAAMLLSVLGVDRETILDDYELSTIVRSAFRIEELRPQLEEAGIDLERVRPFLSAPRPALADALDWLDTVDGGLLGYLQRAGVSAGTVAALRAGLLDPAS